MEKEVGKDIPGYEGLYQASTLGNIRSLNYNNCGYEKNLKPGKDKSGYVHVILSKNKTKHLGKVHKLIALTFIDNPNNYPFINHRNEIKDDNCVNNLEYCDSKYNCNYGTRNTRISNKKRNTRSKEIQQLSLNDELIATWPSIREAERQLSINSSSICKCCKNDYGFNTAGGFKGKYAD